MRTPDSWSLGTILGLPTIGLIVLICLACAVIGFIGGRHDEDGIIFGVGASCMAIVLLVSTVFVYWPFSSQFHRYYKVDGEVQAIGSRQIADGKAMSTRYVFRIGGEDYGVDDTRASLTKVGDMVHLKCKREWVYNSESGWACRWSK